MAKKKVTKEAMMTARRMLSGHMPQDVWDAYGEASRALSYTRKGEACQILMFTSSLPHESKTITVVNMAITMAAQGKRVLLIDADLRGPRIHHLFGLERGHGLTELLGRVQDEIVIKRSAYENLFVLTSGDDAPNSGELLAGGQLQRLLKLLSREFDAILLDSPSVHTAPDAAVIGQQVDGCVLVVRRDFSGKDAVGQAISILKDAGVTIVGTIIASYDSDSETKRKRIKKSRGKKS